MSLHADDVLLYLKYEFNFLFDEFYKDLQTEFWL